jgi:hypothetical protein
MVRPVNASEGSGEGSLKPSKALQTAISVSSEEGDVGDRERGEADHSPSPVGKAMSPARSVWVSNPLRGMDPRVAKTRGCREG